MIAAISLTACDEVIPPAKESDQLLDGPVDGLSHEETRQFLSGDVAFNDQVFTANDGLGPIFVATS
ncbi:MAG TPA: hypothetical protein VK666_30025, partial [Chryseolinea sp.]|nr:hypothetical protein [Chryseolinea sp.]